MAHLVRAIALVLVAAASAAPAAAQTRRAPTLDDLLNLVQVSGAEISPDGTQVLYTRSELKPWSENKRGATIWIANVDGTGHRQFLGSEKDRAAAWSPDGRHVAFLSTRDQGENAKDAPGAQIWLLPTAGGEATKLTDLKSGVRRFRWAPDASSIFFVADEPKTDEQKAEEKNLGDGIFVDEDGNGQGKDGYANLWMVTLADKSTRQLTTGPRVVTDLAPSPDGRAVAFIAQPDNRRNHNFLAEVHVLDVASGQARALTANEAPEANVEWSPDGRTLTYLAPDTARWELAQEKLFAHPVDGGAPRALSTRFAGDIGDYYWAADGRTVVLGTTTRGRGGVHALEVATGALRPIVTGDMQLSVSSAALAHGRAAGVHSRPDAPAEIAVVDLVKGAVANVTDANPWARELQFARMRPITWKSTDGLEVEGLLWLPAGHTEGQKLPTILSIHGGPAGVWSASFRGINHVYASLGWAVLEPNVRGSTSYGDALLRGNMKDIGGGDYHDAVTGVDALVAMGIADPDQLAVRGWSYGGILGGWTVTQTSRFKAASLGAMVSDWASEYAMGFNFDVRLWYIGGTPWENPEGYRTKSAYTYIDKVTTPTLLLHGERDDTCTIGQSMMFYQGLKDRGVATRFIRFPREPHGFREPQHIRMRDAEEISWLMKHTRGIEWTAPVRKEEKDEKKTTTNP